MPNVYHTDLTESLPEPNLSLFTFGIASNPAGDTITADGTSLIENGKRITPVMGEFHYARYPRDEWRDALLKIKAGGVDIVASYVFWIHHEEVEGQWDFSADRNLRAFVQLCGELNLRCIIRCGPWCHGEVRNGGLPDWLFDKNINIRTDDPQYLAYAKKLYEQIASQLKGLLFKDGGPVIGIQIENEYRGHAQHLLTLKQIAVDAGLDVPIYTRTGWPELLDAMPFGHMLPLYGGYAEGFWDRELEPMPGPYWKEFVFKRVRSDAAIANEQFGSREAKDEPDVVRYPYLTCELGAGMMCSYHRRITVYPMDVLSLLIVKLGSGSNSPGYYMYHGGTNPVGKEPQLQEHQTTRLTNWNDMPVKSYDFQTAIGEFGQLREQYHLLRPVHLFLKDFGQTLAPLSSVFTHEDVTQDDTRTFRRAFRTDGQRGFVFINNYHRLLPQPARPDTQLSLKLKQGKLIFPQAPTTVAADTAFFWPFNMELGDGITLEYATAQPVCQLHDGNTTYTVFAETANPVEFAFKGQANDTQPHILQNAQPGTDPIITLTATTGREHAIVLLDRTEALACYKIKLNHREHLLITDTAVLVDNDTIRLQTTNSDQLSIKLLPACDSLKHDNKSLPATADGVFTRYTLPLPETKPINLTAQHLRGAGPLREITLGEKNVAVAPTDKDFEDAATWHITIPEVLDLSQNYLLRIHYTADVARAYAGDQLLTDNFYNATPFDISLTRYAPAIQEHGLTIKLIPLQRYAPIFLLNHLRPDFPNNDSIATLDKLELIQTHELQLTTS